MRKLKDGLKRALLRLICLFYGYGSTARFLTLVGPFLLIVPIWISTSMLSVLCPKSSWIVLRIQGFATTWPQERMLTSCSLQPSIYHLLLVESSSPFKLTSSDTSHSPPCKRDKIADIHLWLPCYSNRCHQSCLSMINSQELQKLSTAMATAPLYAHDSDITFQKKELIREGEKEMRLMPAGDVRVPDKSCIAHESRALNANPKYKRQYTWSPKKLTSGPIALFANLCFVPLGSAC